MPASSRKDNLRTTFNRWRKREHPEACTVCAHIWGAAGRPATFDEYALRYPPLDRGAKRHLTQVWNPGLTLAQVAEQAGCSVNAVRRAIANGMLEATTVGVEQYVSRTRATLWAKHGAPQGDSVRSWISLAGASARYGFSMAEMHEFIATGRLRRKGAGESVLVSRIQCGDLRDQVGYPAEHAAARLGVPLSDLPRLLQGLEWRPSDGLIPLAVIRAAAKRLGRQGATSKVRSPPADEWVVSAQALTIAGVSSATLGRWVAENLVVRRYEAGLWRYRTSDLYAQARQYWAGKPREGRCPKWLKAGPSGKAAHAEGRSSPPDT